MKTFVATFAAILAAAAVLFGIYAVNQNREKERNTVRQLIGLSVKSSAYTREAGVEERISVPVIHDNMATGLITLSDTLKKGLLSKEEMKRPVSDIVFNYTQYVEFIEKKHPDQKLWIEGMREALEKLEAVSK